MDEPFDPFDPQATQQLPPQPAQPTMHLGHAGPLPTAPPVWRRRGPLFGAGVLVLAIAGLVVGIVLAMPAPAPVPTNTAAAAPATGTPAAGHGHKRAKAGKGAGQAKLAPGESVLLGTVGSVSGTQLTINPDSGSQVTLTTTNTKIAGGTKAITDLKPGERVEVVVKDNAAVAVRIPQVHDTGTITDLNGTQATLVEADGQTVTLDLSGLGQPPTIGNVVVVTGSVTNGGRTVQVSKVTPVAGTG